MKKILLPIVVLLVIAITYYLISPLWSVIPVDDALPSIQPYNFTNVTPTIDFPSAYPTASGSVLLVPARNEGGVENLNEQQKADMDAQSAQLPAMVKKEFMIPSMLNIVSQGNFTASAHDVAGQVKLIDYMDEKILRFENFQTVNGPDLRIYLSAGKDIKDAIDLGPIRGTVGNVNYVVKKDIDTQKYTNVLVWCRAFGVLFSFAELR